MMVSDQAVVWGRQYNILKTDKHLEMLVYSYKRLRQSQMLTAYIERIGSSRQTRVGVHRAVLTLVFAGERLNAKANGSRFI